MPTDMRMAPQWAKAWLNSMASPDTCSTVTGSGGAMSNAKSGTRGVMKPLTRAAQP